MDMYIYIPIITVRISSSLTSMSGRGGNDQFSVKGLQNQRWRFAIWRCETTGGFRWDVRIISGLSMLFSSLNLKRQWVRTWHWNSKLRKCFHGSIYSCSWVGYTVGVFNHQTFLFNVACMLYFTCCRFIGHLSRCLSTACNYLYPPLCLPPSAITPTHTLFTCSPVSDLLISPTFTSTPPPHKPLHLVVCCVFGALK